MTYQSFTQSELEGIMSSSAAGEQNEKVDIRTRRRIPFLAVTFFVLFGLLLPAFVTQRESFSNVMGLAVALGSVTSILVNLFNLLQQATLCAQVARPTGRPG
jgi:hypothetical protein